MIHIINYKLYQQVSDDSKYPRWICPGCHLQVESTADFFDLLLTGQDKLRQLLIEEKRNQKSLLRSDVFETADENIDKGTLPEQPLYTSDHELAYKLEGLNKPKKKRGRPPRPSPEVLEAQRQEQALALEKMKKETSAEEEYDENSGLRRKRRVKKPTRYQESLQGKELERVFAEKGVIDSHGFDEDFYEEDINDDSGYRNEVIGHLQREDGTSMGDLVVIKSFKRGKSKQNKINLLLKICLNYY